MRVVEQTAETENSGLLLGHPSDEKLSGTFGREALEKKHHLFLDFPNSKIVIFNNNQFFASQRVSLNEYIHVR